MVSLRVALAIVVGLATLVWAALQHQQRVRADRVETARALHATWRRERAAGSPWGEENGKQKKSAVVVGGTSGIGAGIAVRLAREGFRVAIVGRSATSAAAVLHRMRDAFGERLPSDGAELQKPEFVFIQVQDASRVATAGVIASEVQRAWKEFGDDSEPVLDYLVETQGIASLNPRTENADGLDEKLAIHYFSRIAVARALAPLLLRSKDPRVLLVLAAGVHAPYANYATDFEVVDSYSLGNAANAATFYLDISVEQMWRENSGKVAYAHASPGIVATPWGRQFPAWLRPLVQRAMQILGKPVDHAAEFLADFLFNPARKGGWFLFNEFSEPVNATDLHDTAKDEVWSKTLDVLQRLS
jgi:NAD(P)-dependent dehydrogenase (short-subunit alcohol dehydrogenase family)